MKKFTALLGLLLLGFRGYGENKAAIAATVSWDKMEIRASVSLDLGAGDTSVGFSPSGRIMAEETLRDEYPRLIRPSILSLPVDSSDTLADLIKRGDFSLPRTDVFSAAARRFPPAFSPDFSSMSAAYTLNLTRLSAALIRHRTAGDIARPLRPVPAAAYTGIIILAYENLPAHGRNTSALVLPCLFPKIWDTEMNLIYERNMLDPQAAEKVTMVRYAPPESVFRPSPSGVDPALAELVGENPLRILARGVFGSRPTDPIIDREDALLILSSEQNREHLRQGRVAIILSSDTLLYKFQ
ncbi:hypothetical protein AGMMS49928_27340 [Spirochaetia bacterium]|nr:hypothetical protein AGMMS49928_27340 [Spirochaetia bacterium]